jgi:hypothetical protein
MDQCGSRSATSHCPVESLMPFDVSQLRDVEAARNYLANVKRLGRDDLYPAAFRRLCELSGQAHDDPVELDFWRSIAALEEILRNKHGKTVRLSRTRQKIERVGVRQTVEELALSRKESEGFRILAEQGMGDLTAEYLVLKHAAQFAPEAVMAARARLMEAAIALPPEAT